MSPEEKKNFVRNAWLAYLRGDHDAAFPCFAEDLDWIVPGDAPGVAGRNSGKQRLRDIAEIGRQLFPKGVTQDVKSVLCDGDTVILEYVNRGPVSNGKFYENQYCVLFELRGDKIARIREYYDTQNVKETLYG